MSYRKLSLHNNCIACSGPVKLDKFISVWMLMEFITCMSEYLQCNPSLLGNEINCSTCILPASKIPIICIV